MNGTDLFSASLEKQVVAKSIEFDCHFLGGNFVTVQNYRSTINLIADGQPN